VPSLEEDAAAGHDPAGRLRHEAHDGERRHGFPAPALPHDPQHLALVDAEGNAVDRAGEPGLRLEVRAQVLDFQQRHGQLRSRGSRASRRPSPSRLKASTVTTIVSPGNVATHHALSSVSRPSATMFPQVGVGGATPSPRKERPASRTIVFPIPSVAATMTGASTLGTRCRRMIRQRPNPSARAAITNSRSLRLSTSPRTILAVLGHCVSPSTVMIRNMLGLKRAMIMMRRTSRGKARTMSVKRMIAASTRPPMYPATAPRIVPIVMAIATATNAIESDTRAP